MAQRHRPPLDDLAVDLAGRVAAAGQLIDAGARFVHVHTKVTDEAGHTKRPRAKLEALEGLDPGLAGLETLAERTVVAITGDHATPSVDGVLHTADPTPLLVVGPTVRATGCSNSARRRPATVGTGSCPPGSCCRCCSATPTVRCSSVIERHHARRWPCRTTPRPCRSARTRAPGLRQPVDRSAGQPGGAKNSRAMPSGSRKLTPEP